MHQSLTVHISHDVVEAYQEALALTYKDFQENGQFTDLDMYCDGGRRVSAHRSILLKFSPRFAEYFGRQTCCFCHGQSCDGKPEPLVIILPDFDVATVLSMLEVLYIGRSYFRAREEFEDVINLMKTLGINLPPNAFSLEASSHNGDTVDIDSGLTSFFRQSLNRTGRSQDEEFARERHAANRRRNAEAANPAGGSKRRRLSNDGGTVLPMEIEAEDQDEEMLDDQGRRQCPHCQQWYNARNWFWRHVKTCAGKGHQATTTTTFSAESTVAAPAPTVSNQDRLMAAEIYNKDFGSCPVCGKVVNRKGGWFSRHVKDCTNTLRDSVNERDNNVTSVQDMSERAAPMSPGIAQAASTSGDLPDIDDQGRALCRGCNVYFRKIGGWHTKHVMNCPGIAGNDPIIPKSDLTCPKCFKEYSPHCRRFVAAHVKDCQGPPSINSPAKSPPTNVSARQEQKSLTVCQHCQSAMPLSAIQEHLAICSGKSAQPEVAHPPPRTSTSSAPEYRLDPQTARDMYERGEFNCFVCGNQFKKREIFKTHIVTHFRPKVHALKPEVCDTGSCDLCPYSVKDVNVMYAHIALKHQFLRTMIPEQISDVLFRKQTQAVTATITGSSPAVAPARPSANWTCPVCKAEFNTKNPMRHHMIKHFRSELKEKFINKENPNSCVICGHTTDNSDHLMVHLAWTHQKLRDFLPPADGDSLFSNPQSRRNDVTDDDEPSADEDVAAQPVNPPSTEKSPKAAAVPTTPPPNETSSIDSATPSADESSHRRAGLFECHICDKTFKKRAEIKYHTFQHYRVQIQEKYFSKSSPQNCVFCDYKAANPEHVLVHVGLTHQRICEFISDSVADAVFGQNRKKETAEPRTIQPTANGAKKGGNKETAVVIPTCFRCTKTFDNAEELTAHLESCSWSCPQCSKVFRDQNAIKRHREICVNSTTGGIGNRSFFSCHLCEIEYETVHHLNGHYSTHFKQELLNLVESVSRAVSGYYVCPICEYRATTIEALSNHNGSKHAHFVQFLPADVAESYNDFAKKKLGSKKRPIVAAEEAGQANGHEFVDAATLGEKFACQNCLAEFNYHHQLAHHMTNVNCKPRKSNRHANEEVRCKICQDEVGSFLQYKCHLVIHFEEQLKRDWGARYEADSGKCIECGGSDNVVPGAQMGEEGKSAFVTHMALDHDKIFDYLDSGLKTHMRTAFDDGSIALPPTPPPPSASSPPASPKPTTAPEIVPASGVDEQKSAADSLADVELNDDDPNEQIQIQIEAVEDVINPDPSDKIPEK